jgi:hypothetical protein
MSSLKLLFVVIIGLLSGVVSSHAQLRITFVEDAENGQLSIVFSGSDIAPFEITDSILGGGGFFGFFFSETRDYLYTFGGLNYTSDLVPGWSNTSAMIPFTSNYSGPLARSGAGGYYYKSDIEELQLAAVDSVEAGDTMVWDGILTYVGNLAGIGLNVGDSGIMTFSNGVDSLDIYWSAIVIPEPSTYVLLLGAGIAGAVLIRRRRKHS